MIFFFNQASDTSSGEPPIIYTLLYVKEFYINFKHRFPFCMIKTVNNSKQKMMNSPS